MNENDRLELIYSLDLIGTFVFAISGTLAATGKKLDLFGAAVLGFITAVGGGTIRDVLIGSQPVGWMQDLNYLAVIGSGILVGFFFKQYIQKLRKTLFLFDAIGIGLFTILGLQKTLSLGLSPVIGVIMGTVSAVFGGVLRDVFSNEIPLIFRREIYATTCLSGGILFLLLEKGGFCHDWNMGLTIIYIIVLRIFSVRKKWALPVIK